MFCALHHSHFCPCVRPHLYTRGGRTFPKMTVQKAIKWWDDVQEEQRRKREEKQRGV